MSVFRLGTNVIGKMGYLHIDIDGRILGFTILGVIIDILITSSALMPPRGPPFLQFCRDIGRFYYFHGLRRKSNVPSHHTLSCIISARALWTKKASVSGKAVMNGH